MPPDPRFGTFLKEHREFFDALSPEGWAPVPGYAGVVQKTLSGRFDPAAHIGSVTRLSRWAAGAVVPHPVSHDWCEEVFLIEGSLSIGTPDAELALLPAGTCAVRPADVPHGPFFSRAGCLMIEFLYYAPNPGTPATGAGAGAARED